MNLISKYEIRLITGSIIFRLIFRPCKVDKFTVHSKMDENVGILRIFPSMPIQTIKSFLQPPMKGCVLQSFGAGNVPCNRPDLIDALKEANQRGVIVVNCTQCMTGSVADLYETGRQLLDCGVIPGFDMVCIKTRIFISYEIAKSKKTKKKFTDS
jgi:60kDa lysophospholipase